MRTIVILGIGLLMARGWCQDLIQINSPQAQQIVDNKQVIPIQYTIIGSNTANPPITNPNYPSTLDVHFEWSDKSNPSNLLSLTALQGLTVSTYPGGTQNTQFNSKSWKMPNCHFFSRYPPSGYNFQLTFIPQYPTTTSTVDALAGPQQQSITVPLTVQVDNSTFPKC